MINVGDPYAPAPRPGRAHAVLAAVLSVAFAAATVLLAVFAHDGKSSSASPGPVGPVGPVAPGGGSSRGGIQVNGPTQVPTLCCPTPAGPTVATAAPLDPEAINRTFQVYMNALLHHDLRALKSATCPRLRHTEVGVALHGKYVRAWRGKPYRIEPGLSFVTVRSLVKFTDPASGADAGHATYSWYVRRAHSGRYYVCGFLS